MKSSGAGWWSALLAALVSASAGEPATNQTESVSQPRQSADTSLTALKLQTGFTAELVSADPLAVAPFDACFDERGRLFVIELREFPLRSGEPRANIRMLEDEDNDGRYESGVVFADNLTWPTGLIWYQDGLFVLDSPNLLFIGDTNGDGIADARRVVFTGFATPGSQPELAEVPNSLRWGLNNRIYGLGGAAGGKLTAAGMEGEPIYLREGGFSFDPRTMSLRGESGGAGFGMCFDNRGHRFLSGPNGSLKVVMYPLRYGIRNPYFAIRDPVTELAGTRIASSGGGARAFGMTVYRGSALGPQYVDDLFIADPYQGAVRYRNIEASGLGFQSKSGNSQVSFVTSTNEWFRPFQLANAPDGALHILDLYRPEFSLGASSNLNTGGEHGRIYRIVPRSFRQPAALNMAKATTAQLVATLTHPNAWHRETAARLLYQRQDSSAGQLLARFFGQTPSPVGRMQALYALDGQSALNETIILAALKDQDPLVREHAVKLSERLVNQYGRIPEKIWLQLQSMTQDSDARVRYQLAFTLGECQHEQRVKALSVLLIRDFADPWARAAALSSLRTGAGEAFAELSHGAPGPLTSAREELLEQLILISGTSNRPEEINPIVRTLGEIAGAQTVFRWTAVLAEGLSRGGGSLQTANEASRIRSIVESAVDAVVNSNSEQLRLRAVELLGWWEDEDVTQILLGIVDASNVSPEVRTASLQSLARFSNDRLPGELIQRWNRFNSGQRNILVKYLLGQRVGRLALLKAVAKDRVLAADVTFLQQRQLLKSPDRETREVAIRAFGAVPNPGRAERLEKFRPAIDLKGDAARGQSLFSRRCAACHVGDASTLIGPPRARLWTGRESTWENIVDPDKNILRGYEGTVVQLKTGAQLEGCLITDMPTAIVLRLADQPDAELLKGTIQSIIPSEHSLMPSDVISDLSPQDLADILSALQ